VELNAIEKELMINVFKMSAAARMWERQTQ
jgi:hypothetical protein